MSSLIFTILFPVHFVSCYAVLFWKRRELFFLKRNESAILVASLAGWFAYFTLVASQSNSIPCGVIYIASILVAPLSVGPQLVRALLLRGRFESSKFVIEEEIEFRENRKGNKQLLSAIPSGSELKSGDISTKSSPSDLVAASGERKKSDIAIERARNAVSTTKWVLNVLPPIILIISWFLASTETENSLLLTDFNDCKDIPVYFQYTNLLFDIVSLIVAIMACLCVKHIDDELYLNYEITYTVVLFIVTSLVIVPLRLAGHISIQPILQTIQQMIIMCSMILAPCCPEIKAITSVRLWFRQRINPLSKSAVPGYAQPLPQYHRGSAIRASMQLPSKNIITAQQSDRMTFEAKTSWDAGLCILLSSEEGIKAFTRHCAREFSSENVLFWCAVNDYRNKYDENKRTTTISDEVENQNNEQHAEHSIADDAREIYNRFIDQHSNSQVNLSSKQKNDIKAAIETGDVNRYTFDAAWKEIFAVMSRDSYPRFLASKKNRRPV